MVSAVGLGGAMSALQAGLARSHAQAASAAEDVARAGEDTVSISGERPPDVVRGLVDLRVARYQQAAQLGALRSLHETAEEAVNAWK